MFTLIPGKPSSESYTMPWGELYLALREVVDGGEGPFTTLIPTKF